MSQEGKNDTKRQQPPDQLPVHTATIQQVRSVQAHQNRDQETEVQLLSQGHQTAKQQSLTQRGCCLHWNPVTGHLKKWITSQCHFNNVDISYITHHMYILYSIPSIAPWRCRSVIAHPYIYMYIFSFSPLDVCVLGSCWRIVRLHVRYYCTVGTRSTSISLHSH